MSDQPEDPGGRGGPPTQPPAENVDDAWGTPAAAPEPGFEPFAPADDAAAAAPRAVSEDDLREAAGVARREETRGEGEGKGKGKAKDKGKGKGKGKDDPDERARERDRELEDAPPLTAAERAGRRRLWLTLSVSLVTGLVIVAFVFLGRANSDRLVFHCAADSITAEKGRGFPPWGTSTLDGPEWAPIAIPPQAECKTLETEDASVLEGWYLDALIDQARAKLGAREVTAVDDAEKQLHQALLLTRAPERRDQRAEIQRLLGNVVYWRAAAKVKLASDALADAAKLFDEASAKQPVKITDSAAWSDYTRHLADELHLGPESLRAPTPLGAAPASSRPAAPPGVALPVEPTATAPEAHATGAPITPPDAGVPSGGVLL